ncbi:MAG TPA: hypothetical protein PKD61_17715, partial [Polyangiaceae bacterium]|nr:hypothetical protein [Polyangiaceae bacterium]
SEGIGMCGATVVYHREPASVQAFAGASFRPWFARARHLGAHARLSAPRDRAAVEQDLDYLLGAAMMVSRALLERVGLMDERYFLYYEEVDWATRAKRAGFSLAWAPDAVVLHKEGATIGSSFVPAQRSLLSEYYLVRSAVLFTRKLYPQYLPSVVMYSLVRTLRWLLAGDLKRARVRLKALLGRKATFA